MDATEYRALHERQMENNNGTTALNVFMHVAPPVFSVFHTVQLLAVTGVSHIPLRFLLEYLLIVLPFVLLVTVLHPLALNITVTLTVLSAISAVHQIRHRLHLTPFVQVPGRSPQFLTCVRALVNLVTAVCILAVDFHCFPRELAKTETFGYGLMDIGVGLYVFSNGIVYRVRPADEKRLTAKRIRSVLTGATPLLMLGFARFFVTNEIDYQRHVSEYGVHWNFFITLAFVKVFGTLVMDLVRDPERVKFVAITLLCCHEMMLHLGVSRYVLSVDTRRDGFFSANREGIVSLPGYLALFLASVYIGWIVRPSEEIVLAKKFLRRALKLIIVSGVCWKMLYVCEDMFGISRRLANMGYCFWILAIGGTVTALCMLFELFVYFVRFEEPKSPDQIIKSDDFSIPYVPLILQSINANGLFFFLIANLLTGLVNMLFQTFLLGTAGGLVIIAYYMFMVCVTVAFLYVNNVKLKIW
uniref:Phosphatidylinositol-glycan biosynthesis class W protein n=1 Tax=Anopheles marajoara TaxID=58244 RepID=A0A2M4BM81_9DIPT